MENLNICERAALGFNIFSNAALRLNIIAHPCTRASILRRKGSICLEAPNRAAALAAPMINGSRKASQFQARIKIDLHRSFEASTNMISTTPLKIVFRSRNKSLPRKKVWLYNCDHFVEKFHQSFPNLDSKYLINTNHLLWKNLYGPQCLKFFITQFCYKKDHRKSKRPLTKRFHVGSVNIATSLLAATHDHHLS